MKTKFLVTLAAFGVLLAAIGYGYENRYAASIGIIGGADGPTAIFVAGKTGMMLYAGIALVLTALVLILLRIRKNGK
ncbi:MAG: sodium ion-translocating decarboxylase subunit beta [Clostridia bacterium]|nr:sodium ion-translocating decarboxylase subunit beta [Clostridia bacterium]